jgi:hypothetical protein
MEDSLYASIYLVIELIEAYLQDDEITMISALTVIEILSQKGASCREKRHFFSQDQCSRSKRGDHNLDEDISGKTG